MAPPRFANRVPLKLLVSTIAYENSVVLKGFAVDGCVSLFLSSMLFGAMSFSQLPVWQLNGCGRYRNLMLGASRHTTLASSNSFGLGYFAAIGMVIRNWIRMKFVNNDLVQKWPNEFTNMERPKNSNQGKSIFFAIYCTIARRSKHKIIPNSRAIQPLLSVCNISPSRRGHCRSCSCRRPEGHPEPR